MTKDASKKARRSVRYEGNIAERIRRFRLEADMTQPQLAQRIGVTKNAVTNWEVGTNRPDISALVAMCDIFHISADELLGRTSVEYSTEEMRLIRHFRKLSSFDQKSIQEFIELLQNNRMAERREYCRNAFMPMSIAPYAMGAGLGEPLGDNHDQEQIYVRITRESSRADRVVRVNGDSMQPTFEDGELLLVEDTDCVNPGEIGIFVVAGEGYVKEFQHDGLHSHNHRYSTLMPSADDNAKCIGRVLGKIDEVMLPSREEEMILAEVFG